MDKKDKILKDCKKDKYALFGNPVSHSLSPKIYSHFSKTFKINFSYSLVKAQRDDFEKEIMVFFNNDCSRGANITIPFKERVVNCCNHLTDRSKLTRTVNVIKKLKDNSLLGDNTDGVGLIYDLKKKNFIKPKSIVLILGAGGAAKGIISSLLVDFGCSIFLLNRTIKRAELLVKMFKHLGDIRILEEGKIKHFERPFDLIINATSCSMNNIVPTFPSCFIDSNTYCYDLFYSDQDTSFLRFCKNNGAIQLSDGKGMLIAQAAYSYFFWYNMFPDISNTVQVVFCS